VTSSNNHDLRKPELAVEDTHCKWTSGRTTAGYLRGEAVYAALAKVVGGLSSSISTPWRRLKHSTRYRADELGMPLSIAQQGCQALHGAISSRLDAVKLHEMRLHSANWLIDSRSNKCATRFGDARSSSQVQPWQLARFHPAFIVLHPQRPSYSSNKHTRFDMHNNLLAESGLGVLMHTRL
jgi:hypothetical protein